jgi:hypothetical protein
MTRQNWREWNFFMSKHYYSLFENHLFSVHRRYKIYKSSLQRELKRRLKSHSFEEHWHKTVCLTPDSRQTQTPPHATIRATIASFTFLTTRVSTVGTLFCFFFRVARMAHSYSQAKWTLAIIQNGSRSDIVNSFHTIVFLINIKYLLIWF